MNRIKLKEGLFTGGKTILSLADDKVVYKI